MLAKCTMKILSNKYLVLGPCFFWGGGFGVFWTGAWGAAMFIGHLYGARRVCCGTPQTEPRRLRKHVDAPHPSILNVTDLEPLFAFGISIFSLYCSTDAMTIIHRPSNGRRAHGILGR